tara:strand:+ start:3408 stop:3926 length:519 start_codon:yes stop_codon:yes gene_type:complete
MAGVNKVMIIGNLGQDPEVKFLPSGGAVANISIATSESWKDKQTGEQKEKTEWHRVVIFGKLAEIAGEYLKKGSKVYIEGSLQTRKWVKDGQDQYTTEIVLQGFNSKMEMLDGNPNKQSAPAQQAAPQQQQGGYAQQAPQQGGFYNPPLQQTPPQQQGGYTNQSQDPRYNQQ